MPHYQVLLSPLSSAVTREVMVVTSTEETAVGEPRVLEIFDFQVD